MTARDFYALKRHLGHPPVNAMDEVDIYRGLRRLARESGFNVKRVKDGYVLVERGHVVAGAKHGLTIKELAREMQGRHIIGYEGGEGDAPLTAPPVIWRG